MESQCIGNDADAEKVGESRERKGQQRIERVGKPHQFNGHEVEQTLGEGSLAYFRPWDCKESHTTEQLN